MLDFIDYEIDSEEELEENMGEDLNSDDQVDDEEESDFTEEGFVVSDGHLSMTEKEESDFGELAKPMKENDKNFYVLDLRNIE